VALAVCCSRSCAGCVGGTRCWMAQMMRSAEQWASALLRVLMGSMLVVVLVLMALLEACWPVPVRRQE